ncbi:cofactor-independent phosphoglycerate mutase, partial [Thermodesulfobacteriota bacterium]
MKYLVLLGDGMADEPLEDCGGKTPLQLSSTPCMDGLARMGELGLAQTIPEGMEPGSDVANLSVMGYNPHDYYTGRAPIEAASIGVQLAPTDIAFRCNLVTLREEAGALHMDDYSAGHISTADAEAIIRAVKNELDSEDIRFYPGVSYRHLMVWQQGLEGIKTTPPHDITDQPVDAHLPRGDGAGKIRALMQQSRTLLAGLPLNKEKIDRGEKPVSSIWLWGQGKALKLPAFTATYGLSGSVISAVDLLKGLGISAGLSSIDVPGATGYLDTNYEGKVEATLQALEAVDFVYLHVEAPDEASHKGSRAEKIQAIEDFDAKIVRPVLDGCAKKFGACRIMVLPDHPTPLR